MFYQAATVELGNNVFAQSCFLLYIRPTAGGLKSLCLFTARGGLEGVVFRLRSCQALADPEAT